MRREAGCHFAATDVDQPRCGPSTSRTVNSAGGADAVGRHSSTAPARGVIAAIGRVLSEELGPIDVRWSIAAGVARLVPRHALSRVRTAIYRLGGLQVGRHSLIFGPIVVWGTRMKLRHLVIGERCRITSPFHAEVLTDIHIGNNVTIGHSVILATATHDFSHPDDRGGTIRPEPIVIHDGCWIGARALILPGVTLGRSCVVAAGAIVTSNVAPNTVVAGVPARPIRFLPT